MQLATCDCKETRLNGEILPWVKYHNCSYIRARNRNLRAAEEKAISVSTTANGTIDGYVFTQALSREMDRLSAPLHQKKK